MARISLDEEQFKNLLKETLIELFEERQDLFSAIVAEAIEDIGLANAIREGRRNDFVEKGEHCGHVREMNKTGRGYPRPIRETISARCPSVSGA